MLKLCSILGMLSMALLTGVARAADETAPQTHSFDSAGVKIVYLEAGQGEPVILIHGLYSSAGINWVFPGTFKLLAQHYHVIAPDLRGHGASDKPDGDDAYGQSMVEDVTRLMDQLKIKKAHIVGYSLGGIITLKFVADHPDRVTSAALGGMGWLKDGSFEQAVFEKMAGGRAGRTPPACVHGIGRLALTEAQVKQIKVPVEMLVGDRDPCKKMYVEPLQRLEPDWPVVVIPDAGHLNCILKDAFKDGVAEWIKKHVVSSQWSVVRC